MKVIRNIGIDFCVIITGLRMDEFENQQFCLKWNNFQNNIMSQFEALKEDEDFVDVTLSCHGQSIKAHKVVLSACSPYLKNIFKVSSAAIIKFFLMYVD